MTFEQWYEEAYRKGQNWPFEYQKTPVYMAMREAYNAGMRHQIEQNKQES